MSLKLAISITGDASSLKKAVDETRTAIGTLSQASVAADAKVEAAAETAAAATNGVSIAVRNAGAKAAAAATNVVTFSAGLGKAEASARATTAAIQTTTAAAERLGATIDRQLNVRTEFSRSSRAADIEAYGKALDDVRAKHNPLFAAQRTYLAQLAEIRQAGKVGALSQAEMAAAISRTKATFVDQVQVMRRASGIGPSGVAGLASWQKQQLAAQVNDVVVSLFSGQNPATVALQQGSQITPLFGGIRGTFAALAGLVNPVTVGIAAATGAVIVGAAAWDRYDASVREVNAGLSGLGRASGATRGELEVTAQASSASAGISVRSARAMEAAFLRTGRIGADEFGRLIGLSKDFGATFGTDAAGGGDLLAKLLGDPASGARQLQQLGLIDGATARLASRLADQNRLADAQAVILDALPGKLARASEATSIWARAWETVSTASSNAFDAIGGGIDRWVSGPSAAEELAALQRLLPSAQAGIFRGAGLDTASIEARIAELQRQLATEKLRADLLKRSREADQRGTRALDLADQSPATAESRGLRDLTTGLEAMRAGLGQGSQRVDEQLRVSSAIDAQTRAIQTWMPEAERQAKLNQLDIDLRRARDPIARAELAADRERIALGGKIVGTLEAEARVREAYRTAIATSLADADRIAADLSDETAARRSVLDAVATGVMTLADAQTAMQGEQQIRELGIAAMKVEGAAREELLRKIEALREAYAGAAAQQRREAALQQIASGRDQLERLRAEISLVGESTAARTAAIAALEAEQRIRAAGIEGTDEARQIGEQATATAALTEELRQRQIVEESLRSSRNSIEQLQLEVSLIGQSEAIRRRMLALLEAEQQIRSEGLSGEPADQIRRAATAQADLGTLLERQQAAWDKWKDGVGTAIDTVTQAIGRGELSLDTLTTLLENAGQMVAELAIANPLKNSLLGENLPTLSDVWDRLTGKSPAVAVASAIGSSVGAMTVSAGTVIVNGAIGGGLLGAANDNIGGAARSGGIGSDFAASVVGANDNFDFGAAAKAIRTIESGSPAGNYLARGPVLASGDRAYGAYQVMGNNVPNWTQKWAGRALTPSQFLADTAAQDAVFKGQFGSYVRQYGPSGAAQAWLGGPGSVGRLNVADINGTTVGGYGARFDELYRQFSGAGSAVDGLAKSATTTAGNVGQLGSGLGGLTAAVDQSTNQFGELARALPGLGSGGTGGNSAWLTNVMQSMSSGATGWLYDRGGYTGDGGVYEPAGVVHRGEIVWSQADIRRAGGIHVVEGMRRGLRGYAAGGGPGLPIMLTAATMPAARAVAANADGAGSVRVVVQNNLGVQAEASGSVSIGATGERILELQLDEAGAAQIASPGSRQSRALTGGYDIKRRTTRR